MIDVYDYSTPVMLCAPHARERVVELLNFKPTDAQVEKFPGIAGANVDSFVQDEIGIINVNGLLWTHDDMVAWWYGLTTYESLAMEVGRMRMESEIKGIVLVYNTPGGMVAGVNELANYIREAANDSMNLPYGIASYAMGEMASAGLWAGVSAPMVYVDATAQVGSLGAALGVGKGDKKSVEFISSVSPLKRVDPTTDEGKNEYQSTVDAIGQVFVETVAKFRATTVEDVIENFGQGGELVGQQAINVGLADKIGSLESILTDMRTGRSDVVEESEMSLNTKAGAKPVVVATTAASEPETTPAPQAKEDNSKDVLAAERLRTSAILAAVAGTGLEAKASEYIANGSTVDQVNSDLVAHLKANSAKKEEPAPQSTAQAKENKSTLEAMKEESAPLQSVESSAPKEQTEAEQKKEYLSLWGSSAKATVAKGSSKTWKGEMS